MIENATNLTSQLEGETIGNIILSKLIAFFSAPYAEKVLLAILIVVTIWEVGSTKMAHKRSDFYNRFQQVYDELLKPNAIKLDYDITKGLIVTHPEHEEWEGFVSIVIKRIKYHPLKYRAWGLYKKVKNAVKDCEEKNKTLYSKIASIFIDRLKKEDLEFRILNNNDNKEPSVDYVDSEGVAYCIDRIFHGSIPLREDIGKDGRYVLLCPRTIAKTISESKRKQLKDFIHSLTKDDEIKKLITERDKAKSRAKLLMDKYNKKLAKVIHDLRFCVW